MSGHGNREISGLRFSLGGKSFAARINASTMDDIQFRRIKQKTDLSEAPYWRTRDDKILDLGGFDPSGDFVDLEGHIGDLDWQNKNECLTWFNIGKFSDYRYRVPSTQFENTYLYRKGKPSKSCPEKIVGAAINRQVGKQYLVATVVRDGSVDTLSLWSIRNFEVDNWTLVHQFPQLDSGMRLFTSVFFNSTGTEAVAVVDRYVAPAIVSRRLRISVSPNEELTDLVAQLEIENPYPDSIESRSYTDWSRTTTVVGTSLMACDYLMTGETEVLVDLVFQVNGTNTNTKQVITDVDGELTYHYQVGETEHTAISGALIVKYSGVDRITLPCSFELDSQYDVVDGYESSLFSGDSLQVTDGYQIIDADLRVPALFVAHEDTQTTTTAFVESTLQAMQYEITGQETYQLIEYSKTLFAQVITYSYIKDLTVELRYGPFTDPFVFYGIVSPYDSPSDLASLNSYESMYTCWDLDYLTGQMKTLLKKNQYNVFLSYMYFREAHDGFPDENFFMYYLTDGDPKLLTGNTYDTFFVLSVI